MSERMVINVEELYASDGTAKLAKVNGYCAAARLLVGHGNNIVLTGQGPIWLYLKIAHELHGVVRSLTYDSPVTGEVPIYDHNPF